MPAKIFVGNLPHLATNDMISPLFESFGNVTECAIIGSFGFVVSFNAAYLITLHCVSENAPTLKRYSSKL